jgi:hypothetical protein
MPQYLRTTTPEGDWRSYFFVSERSEPYVDGNLILDNDTVGMIFVSDDLDPTTGVNANTPPQREIGEDVVIIYEAEKIRLPKVAGVTIRHGDNLYFSGVEGAGVSNVYQSGWWKIGICVEDEAAANDGYVLADLEGKDAVQAEY